MLVEKHYACMELVSCFSCLCVSRKNVRIISSLLFMCPVPFQFLTISVASFEMLPELLFKQLSSLVFRRLSSLRAVLLLQLVCKSATLPPMCLPEIPLSVSLPQLPWSVCPPELPLRRPAVGAVRLRRCGTRRESELRGGGASAPRHGQLRLRGHTERCASQAPGGELQLKR